MSDDIKPVRFLWISKAGAHECTTWSPSANDTKYGEAGAPVYAQSTVDALQAEVDRATRALQRAGYTYTEGAEEWKPPVGDNPSPLLARIDQLQAEVARLRAPVAEKIAPVQRWPAGIPWSLHLEAYAAYCKKWGPQPALIDLEGRNCRGGFGIGELDEFIPGWRERTSEIAQLRAEVARLKEQPAAGAVVPDDLPESVLDATAAAIGADAYDCLRVWNAWGVGTMGPDDFSPIADDGERVAEIAKAAISAMLAAAPQAPGPNHD